MSNALTVEIWSDIAWIVRGVLAVAGARSRLPALPSSLELAPAKLLAATDRGRRPV